MSENNPMPKELAMLQTILAAVPLELPGGTVDEIHGKVRDAGLTLGVETVQGILTTMFLRCETHIVNPVRDCYVDRRYVREY